MSIVPIDDEQNKPGNYLFIIIIILNYKTNYFYLFEL
jgi:hypothetical protein